MFNIIFLAIADPALFCSIYDWFVCEVMREAVCPPFLLGCCQFSSALDLIVGLGYGTADGSDGSDGCSLFGSVTEFWVGYLAVSLMWPVICDMTGV